MISEIKFCTKYDPPPSPVLVCKDASLTRQEFAEEADINNIMKRYSSGMPLPSGVRQPLYGDFSEVPDYQTAFDVVQNAKAGFDSLPSSVRERFHNNPAELLAFLSDEKNRDEAVKLGLVKAPETKIPVSVPDTGGKGDPNRVAPTTILDTILRTDTQEKINHEST